MINIKGTNPSEILNNASFNYYFVDEPNESEINETDIWAYSQNISSKNVNGKLLLSDYMWPYRNLLCYFASGDLDMMNEYLRYSNEYIMCDEYDGNGCGDATDFWNEYKSVYGMPSKNLTNWITLKQSDSYDWDNLLNMASSWSSLGAMNPIWIYGGGGSGADENTIRQFCLDSAWPDGWIEGKCMEYEVYWKCALPNPCNTCDWNNQDDWYIYAVYPVAEQWF